MVAPELSGQTLSRELISNHMYGPSYVSFKSALSYHGIIPERVHMARMMGENDKVYCVDIQPKMLTNLERRARKAGYTDIVSSIQFIQ